MSQSDHPPLHRHETLAPFSRDHYTGLVQSQHLRKAAEGDDVARRKAVAEFIDAWDHEIEEHFADEERLLLDRLNDQDRQRLLEEHGRIREDVAQLREIRRTTDPDPNALRGAGERLEEHIRWEERELFERVQNSLTKKQLSELAVATQDIEQSRPRTARRKTDGSSEHSR